ncbi:hypothetical protein [Macrococcus bovicus]|uniref:hypothetical protein n=1 Tax=Macrococcus bovicus TaxID=69968 RepID=UPI00140A7D0E|nr:hypothetical protein [Macrococcus bovicus]
MKWHKDNFKPNFYLIAKRVGISENYFLDWKAERRIVSDEILNRIIEIIEK